MVGRTVREMSIDELRGRVEEAEKLLRVARQLAQDELRDPQKSERAKDRIASLCSEVNALFPGLGTEPPPETAEPAAAEADAEDDADDEDDTLEGAADDADGSDGDDADEEDEEWTIDYEKLRRAIRDPGLMGRFPEAERAQFRTMAEKLLDAHDRQELYARVSAGFAELEETTRAGAEEAGRQLGFILTLENLRTKN